MIRNFRDLIAWQKGVDLVVQVYRVTSRWPDSERFGLISQARRAAVSVPSNIAEGEGRRNDGDLRRFLMIAHGSLRELQTQMLIAHRLGFLSDDAHDDFIDNSEEVSRVIQGLHRSKSP